eukprot:g22735.t1
MFHKFQGHRKLCHVPNFPSLPRPHGLTTRWKYCPLLGFLAPVPPLNPCTGSSQLSYMVLIYCSRHVKQTEIGTNLAKEQLEVLVDGLHDLNCRCLVSNMEVSRG